MDFTWSEEQRAIRELAEEVLSAHLDASDFSGVYFARRLYAELARTELLRVELSTERGGWFGCSRACWCCGKRLATQRLRRCATPS